MKTTKFRELNIRWYVEGKMQPCKYRMEKDRLGINKEGGKPQSWVTTSRI